MGANCTTELCYLLAICISLLAHNQCNGSLLSQAVAPNLAPAVGPKLLVPETGRVKLTSGGAHLNSLRQSEFAASSRIRRAGQSNPLVAIGALANEAASKASEAADNLGVQFRGLLDRSLSEARKVIQKTIKPARDYFSLVARYHNWYHAYKSLYESLGNEPAASNNSYLKPSDLMLVKFSEIDSKLFAQAQGRAKKRAQLDRLSEWQEEGEEEEKDKIEIRADSIETMDYLFEALRRLIDQLETELSELRARASASEMKELPAEAAQDSGLSLEEVKASEQFKESMERLKRIAMSSAQSFLAEEAMQVTRIAGMNALAEHIAQVPPAPGSTLYYFAPLIHMLGSVNTQLAVSYLTNIEIRATLRLLDGINPAPKIVNELFRRAKGRPISTY